MGNRLYTEKDLNNAGKVFKTFVSFQYIEGRGSRNECFGDAHQILSFLADAMAGTLLRTPVTDIDKVMEELFERVQIQYELHKKEFEEELKKKGKV